MNAVSVGMALGLGGTWSRATSGRGAHGLLGLGGTPGLKSLGNRPAADSKQGVMGRSAGTCVGRYMSILELDGQWTTGYEWMDGL